MTPFSVLRGLLQSAAAKYGYQIERKYEFGDHRLDVLQLVVDRLQPDRPDFFFVQVGANDGVFDDEINTMIKRYRWHGILLEPQADVFKALVKNYGGADHLIFENAALAHADGEMEFYTVPGKSELGSLKPDLLASWFGASEVIKTKVNTVSVQTLLAKHAISNVDLLQIDTEGFDCEVIKMFLSAGIRPTVINYEHLLLSNTDRMDCIKLLGGLGYKMLQAGPRRFDTVAYRGG
jgi:FkbM family methyltransferase